MNRVSNAPPSEIDSRSRVMQEKERKKKEDEEKQLRQLDQIRQDNVIRR